MQKIRLFHHTVADIVDLKILQSNWPIAFWPISQKQDFPPNMGFAQEYSK